MSETYKQILIEVLKRKVQEIDEMSKDSQVSPSYVIGYSIGTIKGIIGHLEG